jgi:hypothetical protein
MEHGENDTQYFDGSAKKTLVTKSSSIRNFGGKANDVDMIYQNHKYTTNKQKQLAVDYDKKSESSLQHNDATKMDKTYGTVLTWIKHKERKHPNVIPCGKDSPIIHKISPRKSLHCKELAL